MAIPTMLQAPKRNLFDFGNAAIPNALTQKVSVPTTPQKQSVNEQIMARLLPQGTVTQQIRKVTAPANIGKTQQQVNANAPVYSDSVKLALWKQHGGDESNFDTNDFNKSSSGAMYLKNEALSKIKPKETPSVLPAANAQEAKAQPMHLFSDEKEAYDKMLADGISEDEANQTIKERRVQLLPDNGLTANEKSALLKMQADGMTAKDATETLSLYRQKHQEAIEQAKAEAQNAGYGEKAVNALSGLSLGALQGAGNLLDTFTNLAASTYGGTGTDIGKQFEEAGKKYGQTMPGLEAGMEAGKIVYGIGADVATGGPKNAILMGAKSGAIQEATNKSGASLEDLATGAAVGGAIGGAVGLAGKGIKIIKPKVSKLAETVSTKANRFNALDEQKFIERVGETPGQFAVSRGMNEVGEKAVDKATQNYKASLQQADKAFEQIKPVVKYDGKGYDPVQVSLQDLRKRLTNTKDSGLGRVNELIKKYNNSGLSMTEINEVKRLYSKNFKYGWEDRNSEALARSSNIQNALREWQFKKAQDFGLKNIAEINKNTQAWKMYADSLEKKINRSSANNLVSLTDLVALSGGQPMNLALFLGKKIGASEKAKTAIVKALGKQTKTPIIEPQIETQPIAGLLPSRATPKTINLGPSQKEIIAESKKPVKITPTWKSKQPGFINPKAMAEDVGIVKKEPIIEEAKKYKNVDDFVKNFFMYKPPKKLYRGVASEGDLQKRAGGTSFASLGKGVYTTRDKSFAKKFGKVIEMDTSLHFPRNPLVIERPFGPAADALKDWLLEKTGINRISEFHKKYGDDYSVFLKNLGYDGAVIGDEIVKFDNNLPLEKIYKQAHKK